MVWFRFTKFSKVTLWRTDKGAVGRESGKPVRRLWSWGRVDGLGQYYWQWQQWEVVSHGICFEGRAAMTWRIDCGDEENRGANHGWLQGFDLNNWMLEVVNYPDTHTPHVCHRATWIKRNYLLKNLSTIIHKFFSKGKNFLKPLGFYFMK